VEIVLALCHNLWLYFFCTATRSLGINNGRGVPACAKLGIATVGEKGPMVHRRTPSILLYQHAKKHASPTPIIFSSQQ
jgi:hypothetical protein